MYTIIIKESAQKQLKKLGLRQIERIEKSILALSEQPRPSGCVKIVGSSSIYRIRIGNFRVVYEIHDKQLTVYIFDIDNRKDVYR